MSGQHEMPTASVVRSSQATPARRCGHLCTASTRPSSTYRRPIRVQTNGATSVIRKLSARVARIFVDELDGCDQRLAR